MIHPHFPVLLNRQQARDVDEIAISKLGFPDIMLMENAGRGCVDVLCQLQVTGKVVILCGKGNNGGDGLVMARHLLLRGHQVTTMLFATASTLTTPALVNLRILERCQGQIEVQPAPDRIDELLESTDWIVDALLGTGFRGALRPRWAKIIDQMNQSAARKFAVDIPSGLDCDTGQSSPTSFRADHTCTLVAPKIGMLHNDAKSVVGKIHVADIGCPIECIGHDINR